jgi:polysaccharide pyruvyl transferase WcaK-like protein
MGLTIGLLWHTLYSPNLGVDALTRANISILDTAAKRAGVEATYVLLGLHSEVGIDPDLPHVVQGPAPSLKALTKANLAYPKAMRRCDLVIDISEGDSFTDIYGPRRYLLQTLSKAAVLQASKPLLLAPQTIGPFTKGWTTKLAQIVMRRATAVFARDNLSSDVLRSMGVTGNVDEYIDVAFRLPFDPPTCLPDGVERIGINVSGLLFTGAAKFGMTLDYAAFTRRAIETLAAREGAELWLVPHVLAPGAEDDDVHVSQLLVSEYPFLKLAPSFRTSSEAKSFIAGFDFFVAARMHASIGAFSAGVPVMPVAYSRKFNGLYGTLGYEFLIDGRSATTDCAYATLIDAVDRKAELRLQIARGMSIADKRLGRYEDYLVDALRGIGGA